MEHAGLNQPALARACAKDLGNPKFSKATISNIVREQTKQPTPTTLFSIARVTGVRPQWILDGKGSMLPVEHNDDGTIKNIDALIAQDYDMPDYTHIDVKMLVRIKALNEEQKEELTRFLDYLETRSSGN
jgi:transcriptional regulator with XRE-family HTH domain